MKHRTLPVKRTPVSKGIFKRLSAVTRNRKQRVAAAASADDLESDDHSSKISRALTIIFLIHIVVIGLIFFHQRFLDGSPQTTATVKKSAPAAAREYQLPKISNGNAIYPVVATDNYTKIAAVHGIDEADLRAANDNIEISAGMFINIPPKKIVAVAPELTPASPAPVPTPSIDDGLVEAVPVGAQQQAPRAVVVRPSVQQSPPPTTPAAAPSAPASAGGKYVVQTGDNIWRIANRFKVDQKALMKANGISDPKKLKLGMTLVIPR